MHAHMHAHARTHARTHACMHACMYAHTHAHTHKHRKMGFQFTVLPVVPGIVGRLTSIPTLGDLHELYPETFGGVRRGGRG